MNRLFILVVLFVCVFAGLDGKKYKHKYDVSMTAIFQNEARWMKEWIEYHKLIGVQHFYLYNNFSTDNYKEVLQPYIQSGLVELYDWPYRPGNTYNWTEIQTNAYMDAVKKSKGVSRWLAILDLDEFLVPTQTDNLATFLKPYESYGGVTIHWQMFGTSGVHQIPSDKLMIETLTLKAPDNYGENAHVKTIVHPEDVKSMSNPHSAHYKHSQKQVNTRMEHLSGPINTVFDIESIRINHYWSRDEDYFYNFKTQRRSGWGEGLDGQIARLNSLSQVEDTTILRFVPALRKNMGLNP